ncbi:DUF890 domain-containing protein [Parashewanella spongiae]|uniref:tRNA1(Val) (adenine(37)-N6)-methyltransferase n=1 Tax=Parashewanella spongiae TaxID=342950 RepID=A0A3A6TWW3_9GAMM|nr:methyltransferase [Parashewanella spongiae]MCL1076940.1 methyltransferase [Parashewanella spongiae]RJY18943.1 DUF890 domain-containing protein [Parashewanella spongiae]
MPFTFKQFHIDDTHCGMRVSTDAIVLGGWANLSSAKRILDIGTGCGVLSIMAAQRSEATIVGVEIDATTCDVAKVNCLKSPWGERLKIVNQSIDVFTAEYTGSKQERFEHIICNPPYFVSGPQSQDSKRAEARHTNSLTFTVLLTQIERLLKSTGRASLILPIESLGFFENALNDSELSIHRQQRVISVREKQPNRVLLEVGFNISFAIEMPALIIREKTGEYSEAMIVLTQAFYLKL